MNSNQEFIKVAHQIQATDDHDVVKVAGLLNKLRFLFKRITNSYYREAVRNMEYQAGGTGDAAKNLTKHLNSLTSALSDGDVAGYKRSKTALDNALKQFLDALHDTNRRADEIWKYTIQEYRSPGFIERYTKRHMEMHPEYDVEIGKKYEGRPLGEFMAFRMMSDLHISTGEGQSATYWLIDYVASALVSMYAEGESKAEYVEKYFTGDNLNKFLKAFISAILKGELLRVQPYVPSGEQEVPVGKTIVRVLSAPFEIPGIGAKIQVKVALLDTRADITSPARLSLMRTDKVDFLGVETKPVLVEERVQEETEQEVEQEVEKEVEKEVEEQVQLEFPFGEQKAAALETVYLDLVKSAEQVPYQVDQMSWTELANAMRAGYKIAFGSDPSLEELAGGWAQAVQEHSENIKVRNNNIGNIMASNEWVSSGNKWFIRDAYERKPTGEKFVYRGAKWRAHDTPEEGAASYWRFLGSKQPMARKWMAAGDPRSAAVALGVRGYYTDYIGTYANRLDSLYKQFMDKVAPQMTGLESAKQPPPGPRPEVKQSLADYSEEEQSSILSEVQEPQEVAMDTSVKDNEIDELITTLVASPLTQIVKRAVLRSALPTSKALVALNSNDATAIEKIEFARVASSVLDRHLDIDARVCRKENEIKIQCSGIGTEMVLAGAIQAVCDMVSDGMHRRIGTRIYATAIAGLETPHDEVGFKTLSRNMRKFNMKRLANG